MSNLIKGVQVGNEVKQYDYNALGNKPDLLTVDATLKTSGKAADAKAVGDKFTTVEKNISDLNTGLTNTNKTVSDTKTAVENVSKRVSSVNNASANTLKGTASGAVVRVDDVSPVEHEVAVKVESKNLINLDEIVFTRCTRNEDDTVVSNITDSYYCKLTVNYLGEYLLAHKGEPLTFSVSDVHDKNLSIVIFGTYTGSTDTFRSSLNANGETFTTLTIPSDLESVVRMELRFNYDGAGAFVDTTTVFENLQLERGDTATEYTPYVDPSTVTLTYGDKSYTPSSTGSVNGLISTSPIMEMSVPDGFNVHLTYNQDTNAVIKKLTDAIVALGGTV